MANSILLLHPMEKMVIKRKRRVFNIYFVILGMDDNVQISGHYLL
tara:strand:- start:116 stop:250 length:135 start_codon:yes stop_codon:yes gene_type:complete